MYQVPQIIQSLRSFVKTETRDLGDASGDVAYTGYGFQPKALIILTMRTSAIGPQCSIGVADIPLVPLALVKYDTTAIAIAQAFISSMYVGAAPIQQAIVKSYDADGFTLTWTKSGAEVGGVYLLVLALG